MEYLNLIDICRTKHPKKTPEYTVFSSMHGTFFRIGHILGHKTSLSKFKRTELSQASFLTTLL